MVSPKLVRDKVPQIISNTGVNPITRIAGAKEYRSLLRAKLVEEVKEFLDQHDPIELVDILEVVLALAADLGIDHRDLEKLRIDKLLQRGNFTNRIVWLGNDNPGESKCSGTNCP